jgi:hypothetical protein
VSPPRHHPRPFDYAQVSPTDKEALRTCAAAIAGIARKTTLQVLDLGEILVQAKALVPRGFERWVSREYQMSPKTAGNYIRAFHRFGNRRDSIARLGVRPTTLIRLAAAPDAAVAAVLGRLEAGEALRGRDVEGILRASRPEKAGRDDQAQAIHAPGRNGLMAFLTGRMRGSVDEWFDRLRALHATIVAALPGDGDEQRFRKGELVAATAWEARWLQSELQRLSGCGYWHKTGDYVGRRWEDRPQWPEGGWKDVNAALGTLGDGDAIKAAALLERLRSSVVPALGWSLGQHPAKAGAEP